MSPSPKELLARFGLRPKHSFGQNFLSDPSVSERIAELVVGSKDPPLEILEIGAGLGALTERLLERGHRVTAIERDRDLIPALRELFADELARDRLVLLEDDAKAVDWNRALPSERPRVLSGNLPYQITGPLLEKTCLFEGELVRAVYLVQKEVADRLAARPGTKDYGALSVFVQARFAVRRAFVVGSGAFYPAPRVASAVVVFEPHPERVSEETPAFRRAVQAAFHARRKTLRNAWRGLAPADRLEELARQAGVDLDARGETLSVHQFAAFARLLESQEKLEAQEKDAASGKDDALLEGAAPREDASPREDTAVREDTSQREEEA